MAEFPALPLWTDAYLADTRHLSTLEHGAYLLLLMEAWRRPHCDLPDDDALLARLAGLSIDEWAQISPMILPLWQRDGRRKTLVQKRLKKERVYLDEKSRLQRDRIARRWNKPENTDTGSIPDGYRSDTPTPTPTPTPIELVLEPIGSCASDDALKPEHVAEKWNGVAKNIGRPLIKQLTPERRQLVRARIAQYGIEDFVTVFGKVATSPFLRGEKGWHGATFDWTMKKGNFQKILEGNYDG